jgi:hypothetical protein
MARTGAYRDMGGRAGPGWCYWAIALAALVWNGFGCLDFAMTVTRNAAWLAPLPRAVIDWLDSAPTWTMASWALGVGGGLAGALALLARSARAVPAFALSLAGLAANQAWQAASPMPGAASPGNLALTAAIWAVALGLAWHALRQWRHGVLRQKSLLGQST